MDPTQKTDEAKATDKDGSSDESESSSEEEDPDPIVEDEPEEVDYEDEMPRRGGIGGARSGPTTTRPSFVTSRSTESQDQPMEDEEDGEPVRVGLGGSRGGIGSGISKQRETSTPSFRGGLGTARPPPDTPDSGMSTPDIPSAFGRTQRAFVRNSQPAAPAAVQLSAQERAHFAKLSGTFGARMMQKMGWQAVRF